jgi:3-methyladenine DNA glycosylase AlkD
MINSDIIRDIRQTLIDSADDKTLQSSARFFKEGERAKVHGVSMSLAVKIGKDGLKQIKTLPKEQIFSLCEELWKSGYLEEAVIACNWADSIHRQFEPYDFEVFERWVSNYVTNWADCDTLCNHTVGEFVMMYPEYLEELKRWARSNHRWLKRASAVTLIIPARKGLFLSDILEIADILLEDSDDLVRKGYGWMLKAASESHLEEIYNYVISKKSTMPRTSLRYAIEKMPAEYKKKAMER